MNNIILDYKGIGDRVAFSAFPENYFLNTGEKLLDTEEYWIFDNNPFVIRDKNIKPEKTIFINQEGLNPGNGVLQQGYYKRTGSQILTAHQDLFLRNMGLEMFIRHPKLYVHENAAQIPNKVVVHTHGMLDCLRPQLGHDFDKKMTPEIIEQIKVNYKNYEITQIGGPDDIPMGNGVIDKRGLDIWDTVKEISDTSIFIGVDSGPAQIALSFPRVNRRIVLSKYSKEFLSGCNDRFKSPFVLCNLNDFLTYWLDHSSMYFNRYDRDYGITTTYKEI